MNDGIAKIIPSPGNLDKTAFHKINFLARARAENYWLQVLKKIIGLMYYNGRGVTKDYTEAIKWHKKAAEQGRAEAQFNLGLRYIEGQGVPRDYVKAYMWQDIAAAQGNIYATDLRDILEKQMTSKQIAKAKKLARKFKVKSP